MEKFTTLEGVAAPLRVINVDTDMIIPKQYLKTIKRTGLGKGLFSEKRYKDDGSENPDFVLNKPAYRKAKILVAGDNFGCGSSREHAPWALADFGIRCVISTSFGDIFYNNSFKNGLLPIRVSPEDLEKLFEDAERGANATLTIDLEKQEIRGPDGGVVKFEIDPFRKHCLLNGLDDIGLTMAKTGQYRQLTRPKPRPSVRGCEDRRSRRACWLRCCCRRPRVAQRNKFDGLRQCERHASAQFRKHNPQFRRFVIDRASVHEDKYADQIGTQFVSTIYHGKAMLEAGKRREDRALHLPACRLPARAALRLHDGGMTRSDARRDRIRDRDTSCARYRHACARPCGRRARPRPCPCSPADRTRR